MKKIIIGIFILIIISFIIPIVFTMNFQTVSTNSVEELNVQNQVKPEIKEYDYKQYNTIKVLHKQTNEIQEMPIDEYLYGVVSAEMPVDFELQALQAQAIVARTYTIYKILQSEGKHGEAQICDDSTCCQAWISKEKRFERWPDNQEERWNKIISAVENTKGKIITYNGEPINAFFHSNSGGTTETPLNVWGGSGYPYLQAVATSGEDSYTQYSSEFIISKKDFIKKIEEYHKDFSINFNLQDCIKTTEYTDGNRVKTISIGNINFSGVEIRKIFGLKSANFSINICGDDIKFDVKGYGHGVGMSQTGADSLAKQGANYEEIIKHFYTGVEIIDI